MALQPVEVLRRLRAKMTDQRRAMASRLAGSNYSEHYEHWISLQVAIEATDRAIGDEERLEAEPPGEAAIEPVAEAV